MPNKSWSELTPGQRRVIAAGAVIEVILTAAAAVDLVRRPAEQVRGPKLLWVPALVVQPVGPIAYFAFGRLR
ncbi:MAG: PLDc_N domain-containing protein [Actinobacteria bacterium]|nr:PLDc_N domain-containing protein [Actinomycetota bacterium]